LIAVLNDVKILSADFGNSYLNAPTKELVHTTAGPEFGPDRIGQTVIIVRALYGLKSSATKPNGFEYYEYLVVYVDDILVFIPSLQRGHAND